MARSFLFFLYVLGASSLLAATSIPTDIKPAVITNTSSEPVASGSFKPTWKSLEDYRCPEWFRDAKFGIWAHWGPQCQPEDGDWYARNMYLEGSGQYKDHVGKYGHPSQFGFKDVIHEWKAEKWNPEKLVALYKRAGAKYFFALANHHDNFDLWDSKYQPWNSTAVGPKKNLIEGWAQAARANGLRFGVSIHAAHAWSWYESSQGADSKGDKAGVPYDGKIAKEAGAGKWWEGLDPQDLYEQRHQPSEGFQEGRKIHGQWNWGNGANQPDQAYCDKFYNRTVDLINKYNPDLIYFDDTALPLWPVSDAGLQIAAHFYNNNMQKNGGKLEAVLFGKILDENQLKTMVWDIERGVPNRILPYPWQTDTCIGDWHYNRRLYDRNGYKTPKTVIHMLVDIVSKNGNLLLNVPVRGDGSIDEKEESVVKGITTWMDVNGECIFGTRPWKVFGEGPASEGAELSAQGFNEGKNKPFTAADIRFTTKDGALYAIVLGAPTGPVSIKSLGTDSKLLEKPVSEIKMLGSNETVKWSQGADALVITGVPRNAINDIAVAFKIIPEKK